MPPRYLLAVHPPGKQVDADRASDFQGKLTSVFSHSFHSKRELRKLTNRSWPRHVQHRWGSLEDSMKFCMEEFHTLETFIRDYRNSDGRRNKNCLKLQVSSSVQDLRRGIRNHPWEYRSAPDKCSCAPLWWLPLA